MTLHAYFDDSGRGQAVFVLAGFLSTTEGWAAFDVDWQRVLDKHPPLLAFKMKDAMGPHGEWYAMGESPRRARLDDFLSVISEHAMVGIGCAVDTAAWDEVIGGGLDAKEAIYQVTLMAIIGFTARYRRDAGLSDRVRFIFDEQMTEFPRAVRTFARVMKGNNSLHDCVECEPVSATDEEAMPLQAADYLAWQIRRSLATAADPTLPEKTMALKRLSPGQVYLPTDMPVLVDFIDRERLLEMRDGVWHDAFGNRGPKSC